jgi:hypothetical protein
MRGLDGASIRGAIPGLDRESGGPEAWGGPRIEWVDPQNSRATVFALDDAAEGSEWHDLHSSLGDVA